MAICYKVSEGTTCNDAEVIYQLRPIYEPPELAKASLRLGFSGGSRHKEQTTMVCSRRHSFRWI